jgi:hypothetical protein
LLQAEDCLGYAVPLRGTSWIAGSVDPGQACVGWKFIQRSKALGIGRNIAYGNNNRWAREGGVIDELLVENMHRNPEGNPLIFDTIILEKVSLEKNITLMLNTAVYDVQKKDESTITGSLHFAVRTVPYTRLTPIFFVMRAAMVSLDF